VRQAEEDRNLAIVMDGLRRGRKPRPIAVDVWGAERVAGEWSAGDSDWMRSQVRRWIAKAKALAAGGWRESVPRRLTDE